METFLSFTKENRSWDLHNIKDTCASLHENFFRIRLNIASSFLLQSGDHTAKYLLFTCLQFCEKKKLNYVTEILTFTQIRQTSLGNTFLDYLT